MRARAPGAPAALKLRSLGIQTVVFGALLVLLSSIARPIRDAYAACLLWALRRFCTMAEARQWITWRHVDTDLVSGWPRFRNSAYAAAFQRANPHAM
jgi:hypothetical protein